MNRARLLACAGAVLATAALSSPAQAQLCAAVGSPQPFPPCLMFDGKAAIASAEKYREKAQELLAQAQQVKDMTSMSDAIGSLGARGIPGLSSATTIAPLPAKSYVQASSEERGKIASVGLDESQKAVQAKNLALDLRSSAGDGFSIAMVAKSRFADMAQDGADVQALASNCSVDMRSDWAINSQARSLVLRAMAARGEIQAATVHLMASRAMVSPSVSTATDSKKISQGAVAPITPPAPETNWSDGLAKVANLSSYLSSLLAAKSLLSSFDETVKNTKDVQAEYQTVLAAANKSTKDMASFAASQGSKKGVSGANLLATANAIMASMDHTTWDDPSKTQVAATAAKYAKNRLDGMVSGDVSSSWTTNLQNQAEALKQEAYFRQFNEESKQVEAEARASIAEYGKQLDVSLLDANSVDAAIAATQAKLGDAGKELEAAPDDVKAKRELIYQNAMSTGGSA